MTKKERIAAQIEKKKQERQELDVRIAELENHQLFLSQKSILDKFLKRNAISKAQYDKSLHDLREKMGET